MLSWLAIGAIGAFAAFGAPSARASDVTGSRARSPQAIARAIVGLENDGVADVRVPQPSASNNLVGLPCRDDSLQRAPGFAERQIPLVHGVTSILNMASVFESRARAASFFRSLTRGTALRRCLYANLSSRTTRLGTRLGWSSVTVDSLAAPSFYDTIGQASFAVRYLTTLAVPGEVRRQYFDVIYILANRTIEGVAVTSVSAPFIQTPFMVERIVRRAMALTAAP